MLGAGCSGRDERAGEEARALTNALSQMAFVRSVDGLDIVDFKGRRWSHTGKVEMMSAEEELFLQARASEKPPHSGGRDEAAMTLDELAEALRMTTMIAGHSYVMAEPDYETAAAVLEHRKLEAWAAQPPKRDGGPPPGYDEHPELLEALEIEGSDNRYKHRDNTTYPFRTEVWITNSSQTGYCTGTLIGPSTMISAAHCFHSNSGGGNGWYSERAWSPGVDSQDSNRYSYEPYANYPSPSGVLIGGCLAAFIPVAYTNGSSDKQYDNAVVEFGYPFACWLNPGNAVGWIGTVKPSNGNLSGQTIYGYGYPRGSSVDYGCPGASNCNWPQVWGMGETGSLGYSGCCEINYDVDTSNGQSGMAMYQLWGSDRYAMGVHHSGFSSPLDDYNFGRRFTEVIYGTLEANTNWRRDSNLYKFPSLGIGHD